MKEPELDETFELYFLTSKDEHVEFIQGWYKAGGSIYTLRSRRMYKPWCQPWQSTSFIITRGQTPFEWGSAYYTINKQNVEADDLLHNKFN